MNSNQDAGFDAPSKDSGLDPRHPLAIELIGAVLERYKIRDTRLRAGFACK